MDEWNFANFIRMYSNSSFYVVCNIVIAINARTQEGMIYKILRRKLYKSKNIEYLGGRKFISKFYNYYALSS